MDGQDMRPRRVATYERVSSEDQRERQTIKTQTEELARQLERDVEVTLVERYVDDGVSGTIPMSKRPSGRRLMEDALKGHFDEVWIYRIDRLGRDEVDPLVVWKDLERLGIRIHSVTEGISDLFMYTIHVAVAAQERRNFLMRSADGMNRAAREGRYCGGVRPRGYRVDGVKQNAYLVPDDQTVVWGSWTDAGLIRQMYSWLAYDGWSCHRIAQHLNDLGVPTAYVRDGRGLRKKTTQGIWRPGHVRNIVVNPVYRGELQYGRRTAKKQREVISAAIEPLVSPEVWQAAQDTLRNNRLLAKRPTLPHLLRGLIVCDICHMHFSSCRGRRDDVWYRCNGQIIGRGPVAGRCPSKSIKLQWLEPKVWDDCEQWLRNPGDIIRELEGEAERDDSAAIAEAERIALEELLAGLGQERRRVVGLNIRGTIDNEEMDGHLADIDRKKKAAEERLEALNPLMEDDGGPKVTLDLLEELRRRLDQGLNFEQREQIVRILVKRITVHTEVDADNPRKKTASVVIEYRFPGVGLTGMGRDSWRRPS